MWSGPVRSSIGSMNTTHPDIAWEIIRDRHARLRQEVEDQNRVNAASARRAAGGTLQSTGPWYRLFTRSAVNRRAGTLAACAPGGADSVL